MTAIELRQKLIDQISRLSLQKLFFLEKLIQNLDKYFPESNFEDSQSQSLDLPLLEDDPINSWLPLLKPITSMLTI